MKKTLLFVAALASMAMNVFAANEVITLDYEKASEEIAYIDSSKIWAGTYDSIPYIVFNDSLFQFSHNGNPKGYYNGFTVSKDSSAKAEAPEANVAKGGSQGEGTPYMVAFYWDNGTNLGPSHVKFAKPCSPVSMQICNTANVVDAVLNGNMFTKPFAKGDSLTFIVTALDANNELIAQEIKFNLADTKNTDVKEQWYINKAWETLDLSVFGDNVTALNFALTSTVVDQYGPTTPLYFCLDDLKVSVSTTTDVEEVEVAPIKAYAQNGVLNIQAEGQVVVYNLMGVQVFAAELNGENAQVALNAGIYVVRAGEQAVKVQVR